MHPSSPKSKRHRSFVMPPINEEEEIKIILLRRQLLPVDGAQSGASWKQDEGFFAQLEKKRNHERDVRRQEKENDIRDATKTKSTNVVLPMTPTPPSQPRPHSSSARKRLTPNVAARLEFKNLTMFLYSGGATKKIASWIQSTYVVLTSLTQTYS